MLSKGFKDFYYDTVLNRLRKCKFVEDGPNGFVKIETEYPYWGGIEKEKFWIREEDFYGADSFRMIDRIRNLEIKISNLSISEETK